MKDLEPTEEDLQEIDALVGIAAQAYAASKCPSAELDRAYARVSSIAGTLSGHYKLANESSLPSIQARARSKFWNSFEQLKKRVKKVNMLAGQMRLF